MPTPSFATLSVEAGVAEVVLEPAPGAKVSRMGPGFWGEMPDLFRWLDGADEVRAVLVRGGGAGFSHGIDLPAMAGTLGPLITGNAGAAERARLRDVIADMQRATSSVAGCRKPVVAAIHGWCVGGGVDLITACDVRVASADARFSVREVKLGIVADMGTLARLPALVGQGVARELAFTGDDIDAARALRVGLVNEVLPDADALLLHARALVRRIADNPPLVVQGVKQVLNAASERAAEDNLRFVALWNAAYLPSEDLREALTAFLERRPPVWRGR